jgi:hypothetical protein
MRLFGPGKSRQAGGLKEEFAKRGPWVTQFTINGKTYGGKVSFDQDRRISWFFESFPNEHLILDLGSLEGGQTFQLAKHPGVRVLGLEGRQYNIDRAEFVRSILGLENVKFLLVDLEKYDMAKLGRFDVVFCSGILYHLPEPWTLIEGIRRISDKVFIWTHYAEEAKATEVINGYRGWWYQESGFKDPLSGLSPKSFWLAFDSLQDMLRHCGFTRQNIVDKDPHSQPGPNTVIAAWAE